MSTRTDNKMPPFTTAGAMSFMWQKAVRELHAHELEWFARGAAAQVSSDTAALSEVLADIGALIANDDGDTGAFMTPDSTSSLMFSLSRQVSTINGLACIADDAACLARLALKGQP
jgi:hypothetical protein